MTGVRTVRIHTLFERMITKMSYNLPIPIREIECRIAIEDKLNKVHFHPKFDKNL